MEITKNQLRQMINEMYEGPVDYDLKQYIEGIIQKADNDWGFDKKEDMGILQDLLFSEILETTDRVVDEFIGRYYK